MTELEQVTQRLTHIIHNYCNAIGCGDCFLIRPDGNCKMKKLYDKELDLKYGHLREGSKNG